MRPLPQVGEPGSNCDLVIAPDHRRRDPVNMPFVTPGYLKKVLPDADYGPIASKPILVKLSDGIDRAVSFRVSGVEIDYVEGQVVLHAEVGRRVA